MRSQRLPLAALTSLFFLWGFITCLNDILVPHLKAAFSLSYREAALIQFSFFAAYFVMSLPAGALVRRLGYQRGIVVGLLVAAVGCALFYPAAATRLYPLFLGALFVLASGITVLQVAANPYVAILGPPQSASIRLNLTQAFNSLGTFLAPYFGSLVILAVAARGADQLAAMAPGDVAAYMAAEASSVQVPYLGLAAVLVAIAIAFRVLRLPAVNEERDQASPRAADDSAWRHRHLVLGAVAIFLYVGAEVSIGSFLVNFMKLPEIAGFPEQVGGRYLPLYWGGAMVGRFLGSLLLTRVRPGHLLAAAAVVAAALSLGGMLLTGHPAMYALLSVGLLNSIMFPTIFTLAVAGLGRVTEQGSGILCMAIVGGAILPYATGAIADSAGIQRAFFIPAICYAYIAWYGVRGSRPTTA